MFDPLGAGSGQDGENETMAKTNGFKRETKSLPFQFGCEVPRPVLSDR